jgi:hypothetical protein
MKWTIMKTKSFYISREDTIQNVQDKFSQLFPLLTIHFYSQNNKTLNTSCPMFSPGCRIGDLSPVVRDEFLQMTEKMTEGEIENRIQQNFGLHAEIIHNMNYSHHKKLLI